MGVATRVPFQLHQLPGTIKVLQFRFVVSVFSYTHLQVSIGSPLLIVKISGFRCCRCRGGDENHNKCRTLNIYERRGRGGHLRGSAC